MLSSLILSLVLTAEWKLQSQSDGITLETRPAPSGDYETVRVRANMNGAPQLVADVIWGPPGIDGVANKKAVKVHEVLLDKAAERIVYEVISAALISDRDYILHLTRRVDGEVHESRWTNISDPRRPPIAGKIRAPIISGSVVVEPGDAGGSTVTYEILTDLGGSLPAWAAKSAMRDSAIEWMKVMGERVKKKLAE